MTRPSTKKNLRDGYHIEVRNKIKKTGIKIRRDNRELLLLAIEEFKEREDVLILGRSKNGKMIDISDL
jgi:hypothetical protein